MTGPEGVRIVWSPNFSDRNGREILGFIIHYTGGGSTAGTVSWFQMPESKVSAHFVVGRDGDIIQMVPIEKSAWHAGNSQLAYKGQTLRDLNRCTIGIEVCNHGLLQKGDDGNFYYEIGNDIKRYKQTAIPKKAKLVFQSAGTVEGWWEPYSEVQIAALENLISAVRLGWNIPDSCFVLGHEDVVIPQGRKIDPGPLFPWERFGGRIYRATTAVVE